MLTQVQQSILEKNELDVSYDEELDKIIYKSKGCDRLHHNIFEACELSIILERDIILKHNDLDYNISYINTANFIKSITQPTKLQLLEPKDIDTDNHFWDAFSDNETEISARILVSYAQIKNSWDSFTVEDIVKWKHDHGKLQSTTFYFNNLIKEEYIIDNKDDTYSFTLDFISRCYKSSPKK
jgi:hypothetical protein